MPERSLLDDLQEPPPHHRAKPECKLITLTADLEPAVKAAMLAAIDSPRWQARTLAATLSKHGLQISHVAIGNHRSGKCPCYNKGQSSE